MATNDRDCTAQTARMLVYVKREVESMGHSLKPWQRPDGSTFVACCRRCAIQVTFDPEGGDDAIGYSGDFDILIGCLE